MNLYLISADTRGRDAYDSAVVAAESPERARYIHPGGIHPGWDFDRQLWTISLGDGSEIKGVRNEWPNPDKVKVRLIGLAIAGTFEGVILASFNAG